MPTPLPAVEAGLASIIRRLSTLRAAARVEGAPRPDGAWLVLGGSLVFGLSDSLIALDRFHSPLPASAYVILLTYWAGQAAIAAGATR